MEARTGFEPMHRSFAGSPLTTWVPRLNFRRPQFRAATTKDKPRSQKHDACLKPEFISCDALAKDLRDAHGAGDQQTDQNGPQHVLDVGESQVVSLRVTRKRLLDDLAAIPDDRQQDDSRHQFEHLQRRVKWFALGYDYRISHISPFGCELLPRHLPEDSGAHEKSQRECRDHSPFIEREPPFWRYV